MRGLAGAWVAAVAAVAAVVAAGATAAGGTGDLLLPGRVLLIGEQHGTEESPAFVLDLVRRAARRGHRVVVGLEFADSELARMDAFLDSAGSETDRAALLEGPSWHAAQQYGLTSEAMYGLIDGLRRLRGKGRAIEVVLFDQPADDGGRSRDRRMAAYLAERVEAAADAVVLVLTGNIHSRLVRGAPWDQDFQPMGMLLARSLADPARVVALDVAHRGGTAWVCLARPNGEAPACGPHAMAERGPAGKGVTVHAAPIGNGHLGWYHLGPIHASRPAASAPNPGRRLPEDPGTEDAAPADPENEPRGRRPG